MWNRAGVRKILWSGEENTEIIDVLGEGMDEDCYC